VTESGTCQGALSLRGATDLRRVPLPTPELKPRATAGYRRAGFILQGESMGRVPADGFYVNMNSYYDWATVHTTTCHRTRSARKKPQAPNWIGPYATAAEAIGAGNAAGVAHTSPCRICKPYSAE
jgi:hypothetical protein